MCATSNRVFSVINLHLFIDLLRCSHHSTFCMRRKYFEKYFDFKNNFSLPIQTVGGHPNK